MKKKGLVIYEIQWNKKCIINKEWKISVFKVKYKFQ